VEIETSSSALKCVRFQTPEVTKAVTLNTGRFHTSWAFVLLNIIQCCQRLQRQESAHVILAWVITFANCSKGAALVHSY